MMNGNRPMLDNSARISRMVANATTAETQKPSASIGQEAREGPAMVVSFTPWYKDAVRITGIASPNDSCTAVRNCSPRNNPAVMVMPARDVPGTNARICDAPMSSADFRSSLLLDAAGSLDSYQSAAHSNSPKAIEVVAITKGERRCRSTISTARYPATRTGILAATT